MKEIIQASGCEQLHKYLVGTLIIQNTCRKINILFLFLLNACYSNITFIHKVSWNFRNWFQSMEIWLVNKWLIELSSPIIIAKITWNTMEFSYEQAVFTIHRPSWLNSPLVQQIAPYPKTILYCEDNTFLQRIEIDC